MKNPFKDPMKRRMFERLVTMADDPDSEFYVSPNGIRVGNPDQPIVLSACGSIVNRRTGASHRNRFWQGYRNNAVLPDCGTLGYVAFRAGQAYARKRREEGRLL